MYLAVVMAASSLFMLFTEPTVQTKVENPIVLTDPINTDTPWDMNAVRWLLEAQSPNGGWGAGSHAYQDVRDPHAVQTDPATTSFAALAYESRR